ncbi:aminoglycoside phosphotransferase family protein [Nocardioides sp. B-3]|uniref:aminoglycoside phosphotransferase family protein n=1 Tax=Nocardioides sp. B-3 TaxID=2895565 RepID=UPI0021535EEC|nr:aminoglycoside phosphotransferase family protein [Nocardioides sp. B-3]UUZ57827.1 aminoglycoside phosphotransferase family protein [Nocardioides sp. B-3]
MSLVPGAPDEFRCDDTTLTSIAELLAAIHEVEATPAARPYQSRAWPAKWVVPRWAARPDVWRAAFDLLASDAPGFEPTFLHRDFGPHNLLWSGDEITGIVDWVETSTGPAPAGRGSLLLQPRSAARHLRSAAVPHRRTRG